MVIRDQLPALHGCAYLNTGTNGPLPLPAADAMRAELTAWLEQPRIDAAAFERFLSGREQARAAAGRVVGAAPEQIALTSSTSQGVGLVVAGLDWAPGDEVITTTEEHQGIRSPLEVLTRRFDVLVRELPADAVSSAIGSRTRLVAVSHVLWTTGRVLDLPEIAQAGRRHEAALLVDGAQSAGNIPVDAAGTGADFYTLSGQKWLLGPQGSGALWVSPRQHHRLWPAMSSYLSLQEGQVGRFKESAARFDGGTIDPVSVAGFTAALEWVESLPGGRAAWLDQGRRAAGAARERLSAEPGIRVAPADGIENGLIALTVEGVDDTAALVARLAEQRILVRTIPDTPWIRVSVGAWTERDEIDRLAIALVGGE